MFTQNQRFGCTKLIEQLRKSIETCTFYVELYTLKTLVPQKSDLLFLFVRLFSRFVLPDGSVECIVTISKNLYSAQYITNAIKHNKP